MTHLLALGPHPDDVELSCGGWLALAADRGQATAIVDLTRGELATNGTVEERAREAAEAAAALGVGHRENLGMPDGGVDAADDAQVAAVVEVVRRLRPLLLLAPWVEERHPDHVAAGLLARRAVFLAGLVRYRPQLGAPHRPSRLLHYPQRHEARVDLVVDVTAAAARKRRAIACHASQFGSGASTLINGSVGFGAWEVRDRYHGASIGVAHGEPYVLGAPVPVSDPVAHFAAHPALPALWPPR